MMNGMIIPAIGNSAFSISIKRIIEYCFPKETVISDGP
jgi:hypothetical protein